MRAERAPDPSYYRLYPRPKFLLLYKEPRETYNRKLNFKSSGTSTSNTLSRNSAMKMRRAIGWMVSSATHKKVYEKKYKKYVNWRINFITLTIPSQDGIDDRKVKRVLNAWMKFARYQHGFNNYVWKAEAQERGEIHFHIISDCYIHHTNIKHSWNRLLKKHNLIGTHKNPNSTDVHAVIEQGINDLTAYAVDYMQKKEKNEDGTTKRSIKGRLWGCSRVLSKAGKSYLYMDHEETENLHNAFLECDWNCKQIAETACYMYYPTGYNDIYTFIKKDDPVREMFHRELTLIRSTNLQLKLFERMAENKMQIITSQDRS